MKELSDEAIKEAGQNSNFYAYGHNYERLHTGRAIACKAEEEYLKQVIELVSNLDIPDPDAHGYEGEWEALVAGKEVTRTTILAELKKGIEK